MTKSNSNPNDKGLQVFDHYGFDTSRNLQRFNPLQNRKQKSSSLSFYYRSGQFLFNDFALGIKGNWYNLIAYFENTTDPKEIYSKAKEIYNHTNTYFVANGSFIKRTQSTQKAHTGQTQSELLSIEYRPFTQNELDFWKEKGNIDKETLLKHGVKSVKSYSIKTGKGSILNFEDLECFFEFGYGKIYNPKTRDKRYKNSYLPTYQKAKAEIPDFEYSLGLDTIQENETLLICEGEADFLALKQHGYNVCTFGNAKTYLSKNSLEILKNKQISKISIIYDTDLTGIKNSKKLAKYLRKRGFEVGIITLPKLAKQYKPECNKPQYNDVCDYIALHSFDDDLRTEIEYNQSSFKIEKYLSEKAYIIKKAIQKNQIINIKANTGIGKTYTFLKDILKDYENACFAVPTQLQAKQIEKEYDLPCLYNNRPLYENEVFENIKVSTYDKLESIIGFGQTEIIVLDEQHLLIEQYNFRTFALNKIQRIIQKAISKDIKIVFLSATPNEEFINTLDKSAKYLEFERTENPHIKVNILEYKEQPQKTLYSFLNSLDFASNTQYIVKIDSKERAHKIAKTLEQSENEIIESEKKEIKHISKKLLSSGKLKSNEIDYVFSFKNDKFKTETSASIEQNSTMPQSKKLVFVSSILDIGTNVKGDDFELIYASSKKELPNNFAQFVARFREQNTIRVHLLKKAESGNISKQLPKRPNALLRKHLGEKAKNLLHDVEFNLSSGYSEKSISSKIAKTSNKLSYDYGRLLLKDYDNKNYFVNTFYIDYLLSENTRLKIRNEDYYKALSGYNFELSEVQEFAATLSKGERKKLRETSKKFAKNREIYINDLCEKFTNEKENVLQYFANNHKNEQLKKHFGIERNKQIEAPICAKNDLEATQLEKFLERTKSLNKYHIKDDKLASELVQKNQKDKDFSKLLNTLKIQTLLRYDEKDLSKFIDKTAHKNKELLEQIIRVVNYQKKLQKNQNPYIGQYRNAQKKVKLFKQKIRREIEKKAKKESMNKTESRRLNTLQNRVDKYKALSKEHIFELDKFLNNVLFDLSEKHTLNKAKLSSVIEAMFSAKVIGIKTQSFDSKKYIQIGEKATFEQKLITLGFNELEAKNYLNLIDYEIKNEISFLNVKPRKGDVVSTDSNAIKNNKINKFLKG